VVNVLTKINQLILLLCCERPMQAGDRGDLSPDTFESKFQGSGSLSVGLPREVLLLQPDITTQHGEMVRNPVVSFQGKIADTAGTHACASLQQNPLRSTLL
jgi:hypothetical protein